MTCWRRIGLLIGIAAIALFDIAVYASYHFYYKADGESVPETKISLLRTSTAVYPYNDLANYELGKAHIDLSLQELQDPTLGQTELEAAVRYLKRALTINPAFPYSHLYLGQALLRLSFLSPILDEEFLRELRKAVGLAGEDNQVHYETGKVFLTRWPRLSPEDRDFTRGVVRKILDKKDREKTEHVFNSWELNIKDYAFMEEVLPPDGQTYRQYAEFLGERSLSLDERIQYLSRSEALDFAQARIEYQAGKTQLSSYPTTEALAHLANAIRLLRGIKFYQSLQPETLFSSKEYDEILGSALFDSAKARIETGAKFKEVEEYLREYLTLESGPEKAEELDGYLRRKGVLPREFGQSAGDLDFLAFEFWLRFKQEKYREVIAFGRSFEDSLAFVPESKKDAYVRILQILGDSFDKVDSLFEAGDVLGRALRADPENLETLSRIRRNGQRLAQAGKVEEVEKALADILSPTRFDFAGLGLKQGGRWARSLILDGMPIILKISFAAANKQVEPLLTVLFNDRLAWEGYLSSGEVVLSLATVLGRNRLQIEPVNQDISLVRMSYERNPEENGIEAPMRRPE